MTTYLYLVTYGFTYFVQLRVLEFERSFLISKEDILQVAKEEVLDCVGRNKCCDLKIRRIDVVKVTEQVEEFRDYYTAF